MHKFAILAPNVLALPSRPHNRAFLRSDVTVMALGVRGFLRATGTQSAAPLGNNLRYEKCERHETREIPRLSGQGQRRTTPHPCERVTPCRGDCGRF